MCVFSSHSFWTSSSLDVPAGVTQEEGHTGFLIHLLSAVLAFIFLARRIQPFLSLVDREVEFCVLTIQSFSTRWAFLFLFFSSLVRKIPFAGIELTSQRVRGYMVPLSYRGDRLVSMLLNTFSTLRHHHPKQTSRRKNIKNIKKLLCVNPLGYRKALPRAICCVHS